MSPSLFLPDFHRCFCHACRKLRHEDRQSVKVTGGYKHVLPIGWIKLGIPVNPLALSSGVMETWPVAFHGTRPSSAISVLEKSHGELLYFGDKLWDGSVLGAVEGHFTDPDRAPFVYVSPSISYCSSPVYCKRCTFQNEEFVVAFQVRVHPESFEIIPETILKPREKAFVVIDAHIPNEVLEWRTDRRKVVVVTGLMVRKVGRSLVDLACLGKSIPIEEEIRGVRSSVSSVGVSGLSSRSTRHHGIRRHGSTAERQRDGVVNEEEQFHQSRKDVVAVTPRGRGSVRGRGRGWPPRGGRGGSRETRRSRDPPLATGFVASTTSAEPEKDAFGTDDVGTLLDDVDDLLGAGFDSWMPEMNGTKTLEDPFAAAEEDEEDLLCYHCSKAIYGPRYHSPDRTDFDLCVQCWEQRKALRLDNLSYAVYLPGQEKPAYVIPAPSPPPVKQPDHTCDHCSKTIFGPRYHSPDREDFDLCVQCWEQRKALGLEKLSYEVYLPGQHTPSYVIPAPTEEPEIPAEYQTKLLMLQDMGFHPSISRDRALALLKKHNGNLQAVVRELLKV